MPRGAERRCLARIVVVRLSALAVGSIVLTRCVSAQAAGCASLPRITLPPPIVADSSILGDVATKIRDGTAADLYPVLSAGPRVMRSRLGALWRRDSLAVAVALSVIATDRGSFTNHEGQVAAELLRVHRAAPAVVLARLGLADDAGRSLLVRGLHGAALVTQEEQLLLQVGCDAARVLRALGTGLPQLRNGTSSVGVLEQLLVEVGVVLGSDSRAMLASELALVPSPYLKEVVFNWRRAP